MEALYHQNIALLHYFARVYFSCHICQYIQCDVHNFIRTSAVCFRDSFPGIIKNVTHPRQRSSSSFLHVLYKPSQARSNIFRDWLLRKKNVLMPYYIACLSIYLRQNTKSGYHVNRNVSRIFFCNETHDGILRDISSSRFARIHLIKCLKIIRYRLDKCFNKYVSFRSLIPLLNNKCGKVSNIRCSHKYSEIKLRKFMHNWIRDRESLSCISNSLL